MDKYDNKAIYEQCITEADQEETLMQVPSTEQHSVQRPPSMLSVPQHLLGISSYQNSSLGKQNETGSVQRNIPNVIIDNQSFAAKTSNPSQANV